MKFSNRYGTFLIATVLFAIGVALSGAGTAAQEDGWRIVRADWGSRTQRVDVTNLVRDLIARGGDKGKIPINEVTMGGNPAVGQDKWLQIIARNRKHEEREFSYKEHTYLEVRSFDVRGGDWDDHPANYGVVGQEEGWRIIRADWGSKTQRVDVTNLVRDLIARGGDNGKIPINEVTMGGNPAVGQDKSLHILARNRKHEEREFSYNEHTYLEARLFDVRGEDWDDRPANYGVAGQDDWNSLRIIRAYYGVQARNANVTDLLRSKVRDGLLTLVVTNSAMGGDPAMGEDKVLIVVYRYQGKENATAVREGYTLTIP